MAHLRKEEKGNGKQSDELLREEALSGGNNEAVVIGAGEGLFVLGISAPW